MDLHLVKAGRRSGKAHEPFHPNDAAPSGREGQRMEETPRAHMFRLDALADVARTDVRGHILCLARPERKAANQGGGLLSSEVAPERRVVALLDDALAEVAALRDAKAIRFPCPLR